MRLEILLEPGSVIEPCALVLAGRVRCSILLFTLNLMIHLNEELLFLFSGFAPVITRNAGSFEKRLQALAVLMFQ